MIVSLHARTLRNARGRIVGYEGMVVDITARKCMEAALRASEARYRTIFAASPDFIYITNRAGAVLAWYVFQGSLVGAPNSSQTSGKSSRARFLASRFR